MASSRMPMAETKPVSPMAHGVAVFAGVIMIIAGAFQAPRDKVDDFHEGHAASSPWC